MITSSRVCKLIGPGTSGVSRAPLGATDAPSTSPAVGLIETVGDLFPMAIVCPSNQIGRHVATFIQPNLAALVPGVGVDANGTCRCNLR
jgi:hypothetical protein